MQLKGDFERIPGVSVLIDGPGQLYRSVFRISEFAKNWDGHTCDIALECPRVGGDVYAPCVIKVTGRKVREDYSGPRPVFRITAQVTFPSGPITSTAELIFSNPVSLAEAKSLFENSKA